ncbi:MAG TPA: hypothetical protein VNU68_31750 [Verrucomicrobiae bacterium]|nr:hypothetical protein [Verrucomicrobiae bacterium]
MNANVFPSASKPPSRRFFAALSLVAGLLAQVPPATATDRLFTYSYEPETMPAGAMEFEQWVTLRSQRTKKIGQDNYNLWELREELEYGVTDDYTLAFYLNTAAESFRNTLDENVSDFSFKGVSLENKVLVLNPAEHAVGLSLYLEPTFSGDEAEVEEKIILGQRHGDWKWALNLVHATDWEDNLHATEGELEGTVGVARFLGKRWALGLELRSLTKIPEYEEVETTSLHFGPVLSYHEEKWWGALTVLPQVWGKNYDGGGDGHASLDLVHNEKISLRLLLGFSF